MKVRWWGYGLRSIAVAGLTDFDPEANKEFADHACPNESAAEICNYGLVNIVQRDVPVL